MGCSEMAAQIVLMIGSVTEEPRKTDKWFFSEMENFGTCILNNFF